MALLLLASTTSWKVEKHYCMGHLVDVAFFAEALGCGMDLTGTVGDASEEMMSCCDEVVIVIDGLDDLKLSFDDISLDQQLFLVAFSHAYSNLFEDLGEQLVPHAKYPPPILVRDIHVLDQVFLI